MDDRNPKYLYAPYVTTDFEEYREVQRTLVEIEKAMERAEELLQRLSKKGITVHIASTTDFNNLVKLEDET